LHHWKVSALVGAGLVVAIGSLMANKVAQETGADAEGA
jgi:hypothetical protein